jgi:L-ascorbate metabolism protein UlaG (beta-lactamase superfamily)
MGASNLQMSDLKRAEKQGGKFLNPVPTSVAGLRMLFKVLPLYLKNKAQVEPKQALGPFPTDAGVYIKEPANGLRVTWFGHSASLIEMDGLRVLVDPVWEPRASPFTFMGPKRFFEPTIALEALPRIDVVLISHDHYDHLGAKTAQALAKVPSVAGARWVTSLGVAKRLRGFGVAAEKITELDWTESVQVGSLKVTSWPARHFSGRGVLDRFKTLWGSFVLEGPQHRVYYGADSGWWDGFGEIGAHYPGFDLVMLEIGAFHPLWGVIHLGPDNAARAFEALCPSGSLMMPIHWGLFNLALHAWKQPVERMLEVADEKGIKLWLPEPGAPTEVNGELRSRWWERWE